MNVKCRASLLCISSAPRFGFSFQVLSLHLISSVFNSFVFFHLYFLSISLCSSIVFQFSHLFHLISFLSFLLSLSLLVSVVSAVYVWFLSGASHPLGLTETPVCLPSLCSITPPLLLPSLLTSPSVSLSSGTPTCPVVHHSSSSFILYSAARHKHTHTQKHTHTHTLVHIQQLFPRNTPSLAHIHTPHTHTHHTHRHTPHTHTTHHTHTHTHTHTQRH